MEVDAAAKGWWAENGDEVTAELEAAKADLEGLKFEIDMATASHKADAMEAGEALKASLEAFGDKVEKTLDAEKGDLEDAVEWTIAEAEALGDIVEDATVAERQNAEANGEALKASIMAAKAAEKEVLESHRPEFEAAAEEIEAGLNEAGEWLKAEMEELEDDFKRVNVENLQAPHNVAMFSLGDNLKKELNDYQQAKKELGAAMEDKAAEVEDMVDEWWAINGSDVELELELTGAWLEGIKDEVEAATASHKAEA